jgi:hypothetical protein
MNDTSHSHSHSETPSPSNGASTKHDGPTRGLVFARRAKRFLFEVPGQFQAQLKQYPYRTVGIACAVGLGAGIVFGSRSLRTVAVRVASAAVVELGRSYLVREVEEGLSLSRSGAGKRPLGASLRG